MFISEQGIQVYAKSKLTFMHVVYSSNTVVMFVFFWYQTVL